MLAVMSQLHRAHSPFAILTALAVALALAVHGCKAPQSFGDPNSVIVRADAALWAEVGPTLRAALERPVFSTRNEAEFRVTFIADVDTLWRNLRLWKNVVVLASAGEQVASRVLKSARAGKAAAPGLVQANDIWARNQTVWLILLPSTEKVAATESQLDTLYSLLRTRFDDYILRRMYASGVNDSLVEVLSAYGFTLQIPKVYIHGREDSTFRFRNVLPNPATRIRSLLVTWEISDDPVTLPDGDSLLAWRGRAGETLYNPPQDIQNDRTLVDALSPGDIPAMQVRGVWQDRDDFPAAGVFITRAVRCSDQNRIYYIDAWLYSPGDDKHQYIRQLEILLDSFACGATGGPEPLAAP